MLVAHSWDWKPKHLGLESNNSKLQRLEFLRRTLGIDCGITNPKVEAPTLLIMGKKDYALSFPGNADYIKSDKLKHIVPDLETIFVEEGNHFVHEKLPEQVNELLINFLNKHSN